MRGIVTYIIIVCSLITGFGNEYSDSLNAANNYYIKEQYEKAINAYQFITASGYEAPEVYYNLGNAYYKTKSNTLAIYYYEKALRLAPSDQDIIHNLELANTSTIDNIDIKQDFFVAKWYRQLSRKMSMDNWAILSVCLFLICLILLILYLFSRIIIFKKIGFSFSIIFLFLSIFVFSLANKQLKWLEGEKEAIIYSPTVVVKSSPEDNGTDRLILHEGTKVKIIKSFGEWYEVNLLDDKSKGWLKISDLLII